MPGAVGPVVNACCEAHLAPGVGGSRAPCHGGAAGSCPRMSGGHSGGLFAEVPLSESHRAEVVLVRRCCGAPTPGWVLGSLGAPG